jgi:hypothetical protein
MSTIVTAALQRQYLQTELISWICLVEGSGHGLISGTLLGYVWSNRENLEEYLQRIRDALTDVQIRHIPNKSRGVTA